MLVMTIESQALPNWALPNWQDQVATIFRSLVEPTSAQLGHNGCHLWHGLLDEDFIFFTTQWLTHANFFTYSRSFSFQAAMWALRLIADSTTSIPLLCSQRQIPEC